MSRYNRIAVGFWLSVVCASCWVAARGQTTTQQPSAAQRQTTKQAREPREQRYVLLTDGKLIPGFVSETESEYLIEQQVGTMHFPKKRVEGSFDSVRHAYEYRLAQLPDGDSEERMKLALWCLQLKLTVEAGQLLKSVVELNPNHTQAKAMLVSIEQAAVRLARREHDREHDKDLRRAEATPDDNRPDALDSAVLRNAQRGLGMKDLPVIFDLPLPLAIKRTDEFNRFVHPLLQVYCAKCHDGQYDGKFQLVPIRGRADRTSDALRANLDATLQLIDPRNPSRSVLLSSTLRPHGPGVKPRPIFPGSNDRAYKVLAEWANHLVAPKQGEEGARREASRGTGEIDEVFAVDRNRSGAVQPGGGAGGSTSMTSSPRFKPGADGPVISQDPSDPQEFPIPFAISGVKPNLPAPKNSASASAKRPAAASSRAPSATTSTKPARLPDDDDDDDIDPDDMPKPPKGKPAGGAAKAQAKPLTIDPKLLERALQYRNGNRANPGS
jgi:hypothetical protein